MKLAILLICFISISSAQQYDLSRSVDRVADQIAIGNIQRSQMQDQQEWDRFGNSLRRTVDSFTEARLIQLQNERAAREQAELIEALRQPKQVVVIEKQSQAPPKSESKQGRYQLATQGDVILKLDTETGKTWQAIPATNGFVVWRDVTDTETAKKNLNAEREKALNEWETRTQARDKLSDYEMGLFVKKAIPAFLQREKELGRSMSMDESLAFVETFYMSDWKASATTHFQK